MIFTILCCIAIGGFVGYLKGVADYVKYEEEEKL